MPVLLDQFDDPDRVNWGIGLELQDKCSYVIFKEVTKFKRRYVALLMMIQINGTDLLMEF